MRQKALLALVLTVAVAGFVSADSLTVNAAAAMNGTSYGLQVNHDNSSRSYVQDDTPSGETIYRVDFLFNAQSVTGQTSNFRQEIFRTLGLNPNPGVGSCPVDPTATISMMRLWLYQTGGSGQTSNIQLWSAGNQCGQRGTTRFAINNDEDYRICIEWTTGASNAGLLALWVGPVASACPSSGDPAWATSPMTNNLTTIDFIRMGTPSTNTFGAGETAVLYFDEFESFRTVTP